MYHLPSGIKKLSINEMPSTPSSSHRARPTPSRTKSTKRQTSNSTTCSRSNLSRGLSTADTDLDSDSGSDAELSPGIIMSPTDQFYSICNLPSLAKGVVEKTFCDPPNMSMQYCRLRDGVYAFQMMETIPRSVRIGEQGSQFPGPVCSCSGGLSNGPCPHIVWLMDRIAMELVRPSSDASPLTMLSQGYAVELQSPFESISAFHLSVLADIMHCDVAMRPRENNLKLSGSCVGNSFSPNSIDDDGDSDSVSSGCGQPLPSVSRIQEARALLAQQTLSDPWDFRPDIFQGSQAEIMRLINHPAQAADMTCAILRLLLTNSDVFNTFRALSVENTKPIESIKKLETRLNRVIDELNVYSRNPLSPSITNSPEQPANVAWASKHITQIVDTLRLIIRDSETQLGPAGKVEVARILVKILQTVIDRQRDMHGGPMRGDRNLYVRLLVEDKMHDFVINDLNLIPEAAMLFTNQLQECLGKLEGASTVAPAPYIAKYRSLITRLRAFAGGSIPGSKRLSTRGESDRGAKRMR